MSIDTFSANIFVSCAQNLWLWTYSSTSELLMHSASFLIL